MGSRTNDGRMVAGKNRILDLLLNLNAIIIDSLHIDIKRRLTLVLDSLFVLIYSIF